MCLIFYFFIIIFYFFIRNKSVRDTYRAKTAISETRIPHFGDYLNAPNIGTKFKKKHFSGES